MKKLFNQVQLRKPKRNKFDMSHEKKLSMQMGDLVPIFCKETLPGDSWRINPEIFMRLAPMLAPIMHRVNVTVHFFKVPYRLIWNEWEDYITGGRLGTSAPVPPNISTQALFNEGFATIGSLADYLGIPVQNIDGTANQSLNLSALPFRAYQTIWDQYYRDQNLTADLDLSLSSGNISSSAEIAKLCTLRKRCWEKDYFTSALPWPQRGAEMLMPMDAVVNYKSISEVFEPDGTTPATGRNIVASPTGLLSDNVGNNTFNMQIQNIESVENSSITINDLRTAVRIQEWLEKNARGGARYIEQILHHFGVISSDARLQIPEYLGGSKMPIKISEVLSTVEATEPQGNMSGHGVTAGAGNTISTYCEEHCFIMGIMSVLPRTSYMDGIERMWTRQSKFEYAFPELAHLGEQEIRMWEVYFNDALSESGQTFGYQSRYAEYKFAHDQVHGDFRTTLDFWHMARQLQDNGTEVPLNEDFVTADPTQRIFAVTDETVHKLYAQVYFNASAIRPLPYFGTPTL